MKIPEILVRIMGELYKKTFDIFLTENVLRIWIATSLKGMPSDMQIII